MSSKNWTFPTTEVVGEFRELQANAPPHEVRDPFNEPQALRHELLLTRSPGMCSLGVSGCPNESDNDSEIFAGVGTPAIVGSIPNQLGGMT